MVPRNSNRVNLYYHRRTPSTYHTWIVWLRCTHVRWQIEYLYIHIYIRYVPPIILEPLFIFTGSLVLPVLCNININSTPGMWSIIFACPGAAPSTVTPQQEYSGLNDLLIILPFSCDCPPLQFVDDPHGLGGGYEHIS